MFVLYGKVAYEILYRRKYYGDFKNGPSTWFNDSKIQRSEIMQISFDEALFQELSLFYARWWEKYLSKRSLITQTSSWRVNLLHYENWKDKREY